MTRLTVPPPEIRLRWLVPAEGLEPPTNGLQNRCSTAELSRRRALSWTLCGPSRAASQGLPSLADPRSQVGMFSLQPRTAVLEGVPAPHNRRIGRDQSGLAGKPLPEVFNGSCQTVVELNTWLPVHD